MAESKAQINVDQESVVPARPSINFIDRALGYLSSVRLGIIIMLVLIFFSILGTVIMQFNIEGFEKYFASLTPSERQLYLTLGFFDLYHTWWFNTLMILFALNLVLVSIDIFPKAWRFVAEPALRVTPPFLRSQPVHRSFQLTSEEGVVDRLTKAMRALRYKVQVTQDESSVTVFGQKGVWNRFIVFVVHIGVIIILAAAFVGSRWGYEGVMPLAPGESTNSLRISGAPILGVPDRTHTLPFQMECSNIRVDLKDPDGPLAQGNYRNWYTDVTFIKGGQREAATIYLNHPYDYEGYRFFQASFSPNGGEASDITVDVKAPDGTIQTVKLERNKPATVNGVGQVTFASFRANVLNEQPEAQDYSQPVANLDIVKSNGEKASTAAFTAETLEVIKGQSAMAEMAGRLNVDGYTFVLKEFSRAPAFHVLQVQYDPGVDWTYFGYILLCASLIAVFSFSHERMWAVIDKKSGEVTTLHLGGHTNRNQVSFENKFVSFVERLRIPGAEEVAEKNNAAEAPPAGQS
jgi:cytochrome c biogenesis protein